MTTKRVEMERFSVVSSKPFLEILASLKSAVGHPDVLRSGTSETTSTFCGAAWTPAFS